MTFNNDCKELKLLAAPGGKMTMTFDASLSMKSAEKTRKAKGFGRLKDPLLRGHWQEITVIIHPRPHFSGAKQ
tara:strand:- start:1931 stop:2149 length:219 start_codon:yes stop_codon:yes gene_type:complete